MKTFIYTSFFTDLINKYIIRSKRFISFIYLYVCTLTISRNQIENKIIEIKRDVKDQSKMISRIYKMKNYKIKKQGRILTQPHVFVIQSNHWRFDLPISKRCALAENNQSQDGKEKEYTTQTIQAKQVHLLPQGLGLRQKVYRPVYSLTTPSHC